MSETIPGASRRLVENGLRPLALIAGFQDSGLDSADADLYPGTVLRGVPAAVGEMKNYTLTERRQIFAGPRSRPRQDQDYESTG